MPSLKLVHKIKEPVPRRMVALAQSKDAVLVSVDDDDCEDSDEGEESCAVELNEVGDFFTPVAEHRKGVATHIMVLGASGSGKSTWAGTYAKAWRERHPEGVVICVSLDVEDDPAIKCDMRVHPLTAAEMDLDEIGEDGALFIFDDAMGSGDKLVNESLAALMRAIHERGRRKNISSLNLTHRGTDGKATKSALGEMTGIVLFPALPPTASTTYVLQNYAGINPALLQLLKKDRAGWGRSVFINLTAPGAIIGARKAMLLDNDAISAAAGNARERRRAKVESLRGAEEGASGRRLADVVAAARAR